MSSDQDSRLRMLFDRACLLSEQPRKRYLDASCADAPDLRRRVEALLAFDRKPGGVLNQPLLSDDEREVLQGSGLPEWQQGIPDRLGRYRVLREIGTGSMGTVFEAVLSDSPQTVAIKVLRPGVSTATMIRRFDQEASVLKRLEHPFIARFYEGGTTDLGNGPQPFFALELVRGRPLTDFARERGLTVRRRLELLADVCDGVHHAHNKGVIHRDLKPSNILVDDAGKPRLVDFGVALTIDSGFGTQSRHTSTGQLIGTLRYMSPEQAAGNSREIDPRSDVYALGVIGFELLSGEPPYLLDNIALSDAVRIIMEVQPHRLSAYSSALRGDVETIMTKALEKEKNRRYDSAADLAADIRRYLQDEPIAARPPSVFYQISKYARRNKAWFTGAVAVAICLVLGVAGTGYGLVRAIQQRDLAEVRRQEAELARSEAAKQASLAEDRRLDAERLRQESEAVTRLFEQMLRSVNPDELGRDVLVRDMLDETAKNFATDLKDRPLIEARLRGQIGQAYSTLGDYSRAIGQFERAALLFGRELGPTHKNTLSSESNLATMRAATGAYAVAIPELERILSAQRELMGDEDRFVLATMNSLGLAYVRNGKHAAGEPLLKEVLSTRTRTLGYDDPRTLTAEANLANLYAEKGQYDLAESMYARVEAVFRRSLGPRHPKTLVAVKNLAKVYSDQGRYAETEALQTQSLADHREVFGDRHPYTIDSINNLAEFYRTTQRFEEAGPLYTEAIALYSEVLDPESPITLLTRYNQALMFQEQGLKDQAKSAYVELLELYRRVLGDDHPKLQDCRNNLAAIYVEEDAYDQALPLYLDAVKSLEAAYGAEHPRVLAYRSNIGELYRKMGRLDLARETLANVVRLARKSLPDRHWYLGVFLVKYGRCLIDLRQFQEAEAVLVEGHSILAETFGPDHGRTADAAAALRELADGANRSPS